MDKVEVYTDGACRGNPGPGGWGAILRYGEREKELYGAERDTTNNRMELMAAIIALESLKRPCEVTLTTDSQYVRKGITEWIANWKRRGWKTADKKPVGQPQLPPEIALVRITSDEREDHVLDILILRCEQLVLPALEIPFWTYDVGLVKP